MAKVLVVGTPRSGSTWTAEVLGLAANTLLVQEPDNAAVNPPAAPVMRSRGMFPVIAGGEPAPDYQALWDLAFAGGWPTAPATRAVGRALRRLPPKVPELLLRVASPIALRVRPSPQNVVCKSVYAAFSVEWIVDKYRPRVVVVERDPLNIVASWLDLNVPFGDFDRSRLVAKLSADAGAPPPIPEAVRHERVAWCVAFLLTVIQKTAARHPDWLRVDHAKLAADPDEEFQRLFDLLELQWTPTAEKFLAASNRPGTGYDRQRVRKDLPAAWRRRLTPTQAADIRAVCAQFPGLDTPATEDSPEG